MFSHLSTPITPPQPRTELGLDSALQDLELSNFQVDASCPAQFIAHEFERHPLSPGVILTEGGRFWGCISRRRFLERMSRPYSLELFLRRPARFMYRFVRTELLVLAGTTSIVEAAKLSLQRPPELLYEPLVVQIAPHTYRLLDAHQLLVMQSQIHQVTLALLRQSSQQLEAANVELQHLASMDALTKVFNRRHLNEYLNQAWQQAIQLQLPLSIVLCDVDFFKRYNDTYGHLAGDDCLQRIAQGLQAAVDEPISLVARYGGEEFAIVLPRFSLNPARELAERLRDHISQLRIPHAESPLSDHVTLSLGVATVVPEPGSRVETLLDAADQALYVAKSLGRNRVAVFNSPVASCLEPRPAYPPP